MSTMMSRLLFVRALLLMIFILENGASTKETDTLPPAPSECGAFLAESTIPHAGLGMYAGKNYKVNDVVTSGDIVIPLFELSEHKRYNNDSHYFVWDDYVWATTDFLHMQDEEVKYDEISVASPGISAAVNCRISMINIVLSWNKIDNAGLSRSSSPGAGAITPYHGRRSLALQDIAAGEELYIDYGTNYFTQRPAEYETVPLLDDFAKADTFVEKAVSLLPENCTSDMARDLVNLMGNFPFRDQHSSRLMNAFPTNATFQTMKVICKEGTGKQYQTVRDLEWLQRNGRCVDHIRAGQSTIPHAGRGAFATRFIPKGHVVAPAPLVHTINKRRFLMYDNDSKRGDSSPVHEQLLINYSFGHANSSLLLSPYGMITSLINHSSKSPNVKIEWSDIMTNDWRNLSLADLALQKHTGLAFDYIALEDIHEGDEILLDYGREWEAAWNEHVQNWKPFEESYVPAFELEHLENVDSIIPTAYEEPYSDNVRIYIHHEYQLMSLGKREGTTRFREWYRPRILDRYQDRNNGTVYMVQMYRLMDDKKMTLIHYDKEILFAIPRDAFHFKDSLYSRDHFLRSSFRHPMMIPDDMFPDIWRNL